MSDVRPAASLLRDLRRRQGKSLRAAAEEIGVAPSHLSRIERGEKASSEALARRVAEYYGVDSEIISLSEGKVPADIIAILQDNPEILTLIRERYGNRGASDVTLTRPSEPLHGADTRSMED